MKLLFITGSLVHGGAERHTITLANRLAGRGHTVHFAYVQNDPSQLERLQGAACVECLHAVSYLDRRAVARLKAMVKRLNPTHIVAANAYALLYAKLAARRIPLMATFHTTELRTAKEWLKMLYYRPLFWSADALVFVCDAQRRYWRRRRLWGRRTEVIHNGVDTAYWKPVAEASRRAMRRALGFEEADFVVGMSAVLRPEKNPLQLLDAVAALRRRGVPARALFIGDGPMRAALETGAARRAITDHVLISGLQQDVRPLLGACDTVALCSTAVETFSLAALEAMALAKPVVQSDIGGAVEMTQPGHDGYLFRVGDTGALVERLAALADPQARGRMGANARASVEQRFSEASMIERYEQALKELDTARRKRENLRKPAGAY